MTAAVLNLDYEDGDSKRIRNVFNRLPFDTVMYHRKLEPFSTSLLKTQISLFVSSINLLIVTSI